MCLVEVPATYKTVRTRAPEKNGHSPGPIDGIIGRETMAAVTAFQKSKGLPSGNLSLATLQALGIKAGR